LADEFDVSLTALLLKVVSTERYPLIVVCHGRDGRRWFRRPDKVGGWWFPQRQLDKQSFAHAVLLEGASDDMAAHRIPADAWFDFKGADRYDAMEQSIRYRDGQVLTLLTLTEKSFG
jgi:hypothetical protein